MSAILIRPQVSSGKWMPGIATWRLLLLATLMLPTAVGAETVTVAVASNFADTAAELANRFEATTEHRVRLVRGSSGKLFAQIVNGAPFDIFLSADAERPRELEQRGVAEPESRFTYAIGQLVIWSRDARLDGQDCWQALHEGSGLRIAIANPLLAPYGAAARQALQYEELWERIESRLVIGENVAQTLQFAVSGGAHIALVARSQLRSDVLPPATCIAETVAGSHAPIAQQAVVLARAREKPVVLEFAEFLRSRDARTLIKGHGYLLMSKHPEHP